MRSSITVSGVGVGTHSFAYDAAGNMTSRSIVGQGTQTMAYDVFSQMTSLSQGGVTTQYLYDAFGTRVRESGPAGHTVFVDRWAEHDGSFHTQHFFIGDARFAFRYNNSLRYLVSDHLGSVIASNFTFFNDVKFRRYLPFGDVRGSATDVPTPYGYTGQRRDTSGLMYYQSRYYDPLVGRFTQADTIVPDAATPAAFNRYSYVINNPLKYVDPTGHCYGLPADAADACVGVFDDSPLAGGYHLETWGAAGELGCGHVICETSATQQGTPGGSVGVTIDTYIAQADGSWRRGHLRAVFNIDRLNPMGGTFGAGVTRRSQSPWSDTLNWTTSAAAWCAMGAGAAALLSGGVGGSTYALCGGAAAAGGVAQVGVGAARGDRSQVVTGGFNAAGGGLGALGGTAARAVGAADEAVFFGNEFMGSQVATSLATDVATFAGGAAASHATTGQVPACPLVRPEC
jgi:RHS repeat-associated protein